MQKLLSAGYGYLTETRIVSIQGVHHLNFWGCACPLWWISPSWDMGTILKNGQFGIGVFENRVVLAQTENLVELEPLLIDKAKRRFPDPYTLPNGKDARKIYPQFY